jgi:hypothetical protein
MAARLGKNGRAALPFLNRIIHGDEKGVDGCEQPSPV